MDRNRDRRGEAAERKPGAVNRNTVLIWELRRELPFAEIDQSAVTIFAEVCVVQRSMLRSMQDVIADSSPQTTRDFAGLLATLAATKPAESPAWSDEESSQDVVSLSYERALRTNSRYKAEDDGEKEPAHAGQPETAHSRSMPAAAPACSHDRKCASVTLRMSKTECEQLRERAAEAGLTVSAYLRLCAFEADALRAQAKEALAELRKAPAHGTESANNVESSRGSRLGWLRRIVPDLYPARRLVRA